MQLTPEGIDRFDADVADPPGVRYGCVVAGLPTPSVDLRASSLRNPEHLALRALFRALRGPTVRPRPRHPYPKPSPATQKLLDRSLSFRATPAINDGIVPTLSPLRRRFLQVARADHLDVVGHYMLVGSTADWLPAGAGFAPKQVEALWDAVTVAIANASARRTGRAS